MRKTTLVTAAILLLLGAGVYVYLTDPFNPDRAHLRQLSTQFMEDIQFKDFHSSALYHHELEQDRVDIGRALEDLFLLDPELLDILDYRIARSEIDSSGKRGRVLVSTRFRPLKPSSARREGEDDIEEAEIQLYWMFRHPECPLGTDCEEDEGQCVGRTGKTATREVKDDDGETTEQAYTCDPSMEHQWFMNLDSTLESRDYR